MQLTKPIISLFFAILISLTGSPSQAQFAPIRVPLSTPVEAFKLTEKARTECGYQSDILLTVTLDMEPDWYTYAEDPGDQGKPTKLAGITATPVLDLIPISPKGIRKQDSYDPTAMVNALMPGTRLFALVPAAASAPFPVALRLDLLLCHPTKCIPVRRELTFGTPGLTSASLPDADAQPWWPEFIQAVKDKGASESQPITDQVTDDSIQWNFTPKYLHPDLEVASILSAILMGLLAGLILNIMPCVLPVISLKLTALLASNTNNKEAERIANFREHNVFFVLGILSFFMFLAIVLGATGQAWGALFQNKWLVLGTATLILALSLSLFGLFHLPVIDLKFGIESKSPRVQAFFTGNLTTLLATPCSGPFLGGVLSWALLQGPFVIATVFASIGIGMSAPYLLLIINPRLSRFLPRSGPWIEYVEKSVAFFLVGTAFYLAFIALGGESLRIFAPLWAILLGGWLWYRAREARPIIRWCVRLAALILLVVLIFWTTPSPVIGTAWEPFNAAELKRRIGNERLFVDFTADWCPTCKVIEATVLTPENVIRWKKEYNVAFIKVDMTEQNPEAEALLHALGSASIPVAAFFSPGEESNSPMVLRDLFTQTQLENILKSWKK